MSVTPFKYNSIMFIIILLIRVQKADSENVLVFLKPTLQLFKITIDDE